MPRAAAAPVALRQGPFLGSVAVAAGRLTGRQLQHARWRRLLPDVYVHASVPVDHRLACEAVTLWLRGRGVISGPAAARLWGAPRIDDRIEITVPPGVRVRRHPGLIVVRSALATCDVATLDGVRVTAPVRTAFDVARRLSRAEALIVLDVLVRQRTVQPEDLLGYAADNRRRPGAARIPALLTDVEPRSESPMETRMRVVLLDAGLARPVAQFDVRSPHGVLVARVDLAYPEQRLALEYEGDHHRERAVFQRDLRRLNALRAAGWTVLRFGPSDVFRNPDVLVAQVRQALGQRVPHQQL